MYLTVKWVGVLTLILMIPALAGTESNAAQKSKPAAGGGTSSSGAPKTGPSAAAPSKTGPAAAAGNRSTAPGAKPVGTGTGARPGSTATTQPKPATAQPKPRTEPHADGSKTVTRANGNRAEVNGSGKTTSITTRSGTTARMNSNGRVSSIHTANGMTINHDARQGRVVSSEHVNARGEHIRAVNMGGHRGYVDHTFVRGGRPYMRRTYVVNGRAYARAYPGYYYRGRIYYGYAPGFYYVPAFYGWAYDPWGAPVAYGWGWGGAWYGYYGGYFAPYAVYPAANLWLTDYVISQNLQAAYEAGAASTQANAPAQGQVSENSGNAGGSNPLVLTPEIKQAIAEEVKAELAAERAAAANPQGATAAPSGDQLPDALNPTNRTFIVATALTGQLPDGMECSLSQGDVLTRIDDTPDANQNVKVLVSAGQKNDCNAGAQIAVAVNDLQDMQNAFRERIDDGLKTLADNQGKNGLPASPSTAATPVPGSQVQPDLDAVASLQKQEQDADAAEKEVAQSANPGAGN
jgi:hypothetical protein